MGNDSKVSRFCPSSTAVGISEKHPLVCACGAAEASIDAGIDDGARKMHPKKSVVPDTLHRAGGPVQSDLI